MPKSAVLVVAVLLASGGVAAAVGVSNGLGARNAAASTAVDGVSNADIVATLDNGTITVTVTANGAPITNGTVEVNDYELITDANGTVTANATELADDESLDELTIEVESNGFEGEVKYDVRDGALDIQTEEYDYDTHEEAEEDDESERDPDD